MKNSTVVVKSNGVSFLGLLTILFIGLKLTGYISWSWLWVLAPLWIGLAAGLGLLLTGIILIIVAYYAKR